jgi:uncharacterized protein YkwD
MPLSRHICVGFIVLAAALAVSLGLVEAPAAGTTGTTLTQSERSLVTAVNNVRRARGLRPLRVDTSIVRAARSYSATMLRTGRFAHGDLGARLSRYGVRGPLYGENLAWAVGSRAAARNIVRSWMASPGHRANLLRPGWRRIGIGALRGTFQGHAGATVVTADFAGS